MGPTSAQLSTEVVLGNTSDWRYLVQTLPKSGLLLELARLSREGYLLTVTLFLYGMYCIRAFPGFLPKKSDFQAHFVHVPVVLTSALHTGDSSP